MERAIRKKISVVLIVAVLLIAAGAGIAWWRERESRKAKPLVDLRGSGGALTIAATGDWLTQGPMPSGQVEHNFADVVQIVKNASIGLTNLEENLLDETRIPPADDPGSPRWPHGTLSDADALRQAGFSVISLANNHGIDYGFDGLQQTAAVLDHAGLLHAGAGATLSQAEMPVYLGAPPNRVAVIAVATSAAGQARATETRGEIQGRPGVNVLRYVPDVTVDPVTFATLQKSAIASRPTEADAGSGDRATPSRQTQDQLVVAGTPIKKGSQTGVNFIPNDGDLAGLLSQIRLAKSRSNIVVLMLHSHEPSNLSPAPAAFVQTIARQAVDAGAKLVIGSGPHQLRGIEIYNGSAIFYSLGNFSYNYNAIDARAADSYDAGEDLYGLALGAASGTQPAPIPPAAEPPWWESVIAVAKLNNGALESIELRPIDLGVDRPLAQRGMPQLATGRTAEILDRLTRLSRQMGTTIREQNGSGIIDLAGQAQHLVEPAAKR